MKKRITSYDDLVEDLIIEENDYYYLITSVTSEGIEFKGINLPSTRILHDNGSVPADQIKSSIKNGYKWFIIGLAKDHPEYLL